MNEQRNIASHVHSTPRRLTRYKAGRVNVDERHFGISGVAHEQRAPRIRRAVRNKDHMLCPQRYPGDINRASLGSEVASKLDV